MIFSRIVVIIFVIIVIILESVAILEITGYSIYFNNSQKSIFDSAYKEAESKNFLPRSGVCIMQTEDSDIFRTLKPNCSTIFQGITSWLDPTLIEINSAGYRGELYPKEKPEGVYRVVVLGDSFTFGVGLNVTETFPYLLEEMLNEDSDVEYQVINLAVPSYNLEDNVNMLKYRGTDYEPDTVILTYLFNDIENNTRRSELERHAREEFDLSELNEVQKGLFYSYYSAKMYNLELENISLSDLVLMFESLLDQVKYMSEEFDFEVVLWSWDLIEEDIDITSIYLDITSIYLIGDHILIDYAEENGWSVVTTDNIYEEYPPELLHLHPLDTHPTALFNREVAEKLYKELLDSHLNIPLVS